jgi:hypothetical protein
MISMALDQLKRLTLGMEELIPSCGDINHRIKRKENE